MRTLAAFTLLTSFLVSCGSSSVQNLQNIQFDSTVSSDQQTTMQSDFNLIANTPSLPFPQEATHYGVSDFSAASLTTLLTTGMAYIVGESYDYTSSSNQVCTTGCSSEQEEDASGGGVTVMSNVGASAFKQEVKDSSQFSLLINGTAVPINSNNNGIIKIGSGLFMHLRYNTGTTTAMSDTIGRLGTYFHEIWHSHGNRNSNNLDFSHIQCASGDFSGEYACDNFKNGAYNLGAYIIEAFYLTCSNCTATDTNLLLLQIADQFSRTDPSVTNYGDIHSDHL